jgi:tetratricopeptide (TPR) repeat protein
MTLRAEILHSRGEAFEQLGRYEEALADFEAALEVARSSTWAWLRAQEYVAIVGALRALERYEDAERIIPDALHEARDAGFEYVEARVLCLSGELAWDRGDAARAREQLQGGLRIAQESRDLEGEAFARTGLLQAGLCLGPLDRAIADGVRARQLWQRLGHRPAAVGVAHRLGTLRALTGDVRQAETLFDEARRESGELGMPRDLSFTLVGLALVARARGDVGPAIQLLAEAVDVAAGARATTATVAALISRIMIWQELGVADAAREDLRAIRNVPDIPTTYLASLQQAADAWLRVIDGEPGDARRRFAHARGSAEGLLISRIGCGAIEIRTWDVVGDATAMIDAATWMAEGIDGGPVANALAAWARASARPGERMPAVDAARHAGDRMLLWRACALAADAADEGGDAKTASRLRDEARAIVGHVADSLAGTPFYGSFIARAQVASLLD